MPCVSGVTGCVVRRWGNIQEPLSDCEEDYDDGEEDEVRHRTARTVPH